VNDPAETAAAQPPPARRRARWQQVLFGLGIGLIVYLVVAYLLMPALWRHYAHRHPAIDETPGITLTGDDHPGDPINVALIGSETDVKRIMLAAKWFPADPLGLRSDLKIAADTVLERPYDEAPVSSLYLWGRKEDLAFEQPVGDDPRQRHHVRFWKSAQLDAQGRPAWMGSATYDKRVGLSHTTGQVTHHIAADVDAERDHLFANLKQTGDLADEQFIDGFHKVREGINGGGDPWHTDGRLEVGSIKAR
jgi:hypothetical protein